MINCSDLLQKLIQFKTITPHDKQCFEFLKEILESMGFVVEIVEFTQDGYAPVKNLYAKKGIGGKNFCFAGHIDVVPTGDITKWSCDPFTGTIKDNMIYGRGVVDMKGAIAAFIHVLSRTVDEGNILGEHSISMLLTADEEGIAVNGIKKMVDWLSKKNEHIDFCLIGEPTSHHHIGDTIKIGARGSVTVHIEVFGKQGHVAYHEQTRNPIPILANIIEALSDKSFDNGNIFFQPSNLEFTNVVVGNIAENIVPQSAKGQCNVRFGNMHTAEDIVRTVKEVCSQYTEDYDITFHSSGEAFVTAHEEILHFAVESIREIQGFNPAVNTLGGTSDARFLAKFCPVIELGLLNQTAHQIDEHASLQDIDQLINIYDLILKKWHKHIAP